MIQKYRQFLKIPNVCHGRQAKASCNVLERRIDMMKTNIGFVTVCVCMTWGSETGERDELMLVLCK